MSCRTATWSCFGSMSSPELAESGCPRDRIQSVDALRGASILLMVLYHLGYNLVSFGMLPDQVLFNPLLSFLQVVFSSIFIALCGFSSRYSRSNARRGGRILLLALCVTAVTYFVPNNWILFGILHFLGLALLLYALTRSVFDRVPQKVQPWLYMGLFLAFYFLLTYLNAPAHNVHNPPHLWILGIADAHFSSADYFPLLPWFFMFLFGTWLGEVSRENRMPAWFYEFHCPPLAAVGRHTLLIYIAHQPVILLLVYALWRMGS